MIVPTVGRVVLYFVRESKYDFGFCLNAGRPHAATVVYVHGNNMVNLSVTDANGRQFSKTSVTLRQPEDPEPAGCADWCEWMPYQVQAAAKAG